jgi:hypothetical protein
MLSVCQGTLWTCVNCRNILAPRLTKTWKLWLQTFSEDLLRLLNNS